MVFAGIDYVFGEAEPVGPPGLAVCRNRADEKVAGPALDYIIAELDAKVLYRYFDNKLSLLVRVLHRPYSRFVESFAAHLHLDGCGPSRLKFRPADTDYRGGDFAVRLENEFPAALLCFPCADEKVRELPVSIDDDIDAVFTDIRALAAGQHGNKKTIKNQEHEPFHKVNFSHILMYAAIKKEASLSTCLMANYCWPWPRQTNYLRRRRKRPPKPSKKIVIGSGTIVTFTEATGVV